MDAVIPGPELSDATGWDAEARWATIRMGDIDGDGLADVCARAAEGVRCWRSTGTGFGDAIVGPELSDAVGWSVLMHATSLRLADFDGDGDDDVCARAGAGFRCYRSTGDGFDGAALGPDLSNATGWADASNYGTIQMGDVDGDGRADVCARADAGMRCWLSDGDGFPTMIDGPAWSDAAGFDHVSYWGTIRLLDVDGDSRADLCARTSEGFACHLSTGDGFGPAAMGPPLVDSSGWGDYDNYSTLRMADVDGDGSADLCGRSNSDFRCWLWDGAAHATTIVGPELSDASNWDEPQYFRTLRLADVTGDGLADICGRGGAGISCWPSTGDAFGEAVTGPELSDAVGWANDRYYGTLRLAGPRCTPREEICNDEDDDCDGIVDEDACAPGDGGTVPARDGGFAPGDDAGPIPPLADAGGGGGSMSGGCGCRVTAAGAFHPLWLAFVLLCWRVVRRRRADLSGRR
jgi:MYXO-CTERM domain-containing protein